MEGRLRLGLSGQERREKLRFIRPEPILGIKLKQRKPLILPEDLYEWATDWVYDVGAVLRSRESMVSFVAGIVQMAVIYGVLFKIVPGLRHFEETFLRR
jgi:hypothetical protein